MRQSASKPSPRGPVLLRERSRLSDRGVEVVAVGEEPQQALARAAARRRRHGVRRERLERVADRAHAGIVRAGRIPGAPTQPRQHEIAAKEHRVVVRGRAVVSDERGGRLRGLLLLQRELSARPREQVRGAVVLRPGRRKVARQQLRAALRVAGGDERAAEPAPVRRGQARLRLGRRRVSRTRASTAARPSRAPRGAGRGPPRARARRRGPRVRDESVAIASSADCAGTDVDFETSASTSAASRTFPDFSSMRE